MLLQNSLQMEHVNQGTRRGSRGTSNLQRIISGMPLQRDPHMSV